MWMSRFSQIYWPSTWSSWRRLVPPSELNLKTLIPIHRNSVTSSSTVSAHRRGRQIRQHRADELKVSREQSVTGHVSPLMIYSHWSAGWRSSAVTCKRSSSLIRHIHKRSHFRPTITSGPAVASSRKFHISYSTSTVCYLKTKKCGLTIHYKLFLRFKSPF